MVSPIAYTSEMKTNKVKENHREKSAGTGLLMYSARGTSGFEHMREQEIN